MFFCLGKWQVCGCKSLTAKSNFNLPWWDKKFHFAWVDLILAMILLWTMPHCVSISQGCFYCSARNFFSEGIVLGCAFLFKKYCVHSILSLELALNHISTTFSLFESYRPSWPVAFSVKVTPQNIISEKSGTWQQK